MVVGSYGIIVHIAVVLALIRVEVYHSCISSIFLLIQIMVHKMRSGFGDSKILIMEGMILEIEKLFLKVFCKVILVI